MKGTSLAFKYYVFFEIEKLTKNMQVLPLKK